MSSTQTQFSGSLATRVLIASAISVLLSLAMLTPSASASKQVARTIDTLAAGIALDQSSGDFYVVPRGGDRIDRYDPDGDPVSQFGSTGSGNGEFNFEAVARIGIAVDNSSGPSAGSVYVADFGNNRVQKFDAAGNYISQFGTAGSGNGQFQSPGGIGVDPTDGSVYVADLGNNRVQKFDEDGNYVSQFGTPGSEGGQFSFFPSDGADIAVDSTGDVYVLEAFMRVQRFSSAGVFETVFGGETLADPSDFPLALAVNSSNDHVFVGLRESDGVPVYEFDSSEAVIDTHGAGIALNTPTALTTSSDPSGPLYYGLTSGSEGFALYILDEISAPVATFDSISGVSADEATFHGLVNPNGSETGYRFEYRADGTTGWSRFSANDVVAGSGTVDVPVEQTVTGLEPNILYHVRLVAAKPLGGPSHTSAEQTFMTEALPASGSTRSAFPIGDTFATLRGLVDPNNAPTTYYFEYGTDASYGSRIPLASGANAGQGGDLIGVEQTVTGLQPLTTYHFRLVATNPFGASLVGVDMTFTTISTAQAAWPARGIELVTPPDKADQVPLFPLADPAGGRAVWGTLTGAPGSPSGSGGVFVAERGQSSWQSTTLLPPRDQLVGGGQLSYTLLAASPDFSERVFKVAVSFITQQVSDTSYVRVGSGGTQEVLGTIERQFIGANGEDPVAVSPDLDHVYMHTNQQIDPEHQPATGQVYDLGSGSPVLVSRLEDGSVPPCGVRGGQFSGFSSLYYRPSSISTDPDAPPRLAFGAAPSCEIEHIYVRDVEGGQTIRLTGSPVSGEEFSEFFIKGDADLSQVIFATRTNLDPADSGTATDIYRWSEDGGVDCLTCVAPVDADVFAKSDVAGYLTNVVVSPDLSHVYFTSTEELVPGQPSLNGDGTNLYVWADGGIDYVAPVDGPLNETFGTSNPNSAITTPDGDTLVFRSNQPGVTPDRSSGNCATLAETPVRCYQFYRYTHSTGTLECITCDRAGQQFPQPKSEFALFSPEAVSESFFWARALAASPLSDDGRTFVFSSDRAYVARDINRSRDIYEWRDGRLRLVTDGVSEYPSRPDTDFNTPRLIGLSGDGTDLFFTLGARVTGHEIENSAQLFDARVGGGFPPPPTPPAACVEDACQGPLDVPPGLSSSGSSTLQGPGNQAQRIRKKQRGRCVSRKSKASRGAKCKRTRNGQKRKPTNAKKG